MELLTIIDNDATDWAPGHQSGQVDIQSDHNYVDVGITGGLMDGNLNLDYNGLKDKKIWALCTHLIYCLTSLGVRLLHFVTNIL